MFLAVSLFYTESLYHVDLREPQDILCVIPCSKQGEPQTQVGRHRDLLKGSTKISRDGESTATLCNLFHLLVILRVTC